jgi:hypothetical protein
LTIIEFGQDSEILSLIKDVHSARGLHVAVLSATKFVNDGSEITAPTLRRVTWFLSEPKLAEWLCIGSGRRMHQCGVFGVCFRMSADPISGCWTQSHGRLAMIRPKWLFLTIVNGSAAT